jgi:hypothetical protein
MPATGTVRRRQQVMNEQVQRFVGNRLEVASLLLSHMKVTSNGESLSQSYNLPTECITFKNQEPVLFTHGQAALTHTAHFKFLKMYGIDIKSGTAERNL